MKYTIITTREGVAGFSVDTSRRSENGVWNAQTRAVPYAGAHFMRVGDFFVAYDEQGRAFCSCEYKPEHDETEPVWECEGMRNDRTVHQLPHLLRALKHITARRHPHFHAIKAEIRREMREWASRA